jgi:hypothetical protein
MSRLRSSSLGAALLAAALLADCAHQTVADGPTGTKASGVIGYVNMDALVKKHPLYGQLAQLDADMQAIQLKTLEANVPRSGADIARQEQQLERELDQASARARKALKDKQEEYGKREQAAIDAALVAAGVAVPAGGSIAGGIAATAQQQQGAVVAIDRRNQEAFRAQLIEQNRAAIASLERSLSEKAAREYRVEAEALQKKEADLALQQASADSAERLSLTTKLQNLALDDAAREDTRKQLDALNQSETDAVAALKNRDQMTLAALQTKLRAQEQADLQTQGRAIQARTLAKLGTPAGSPAQLATTPGGVIPGPPGRSGAAPSLPPDMRARIEALHKKYQDDFTKDAEQTVAEFEKTKNDLTARFRKLHGVDGAAQGSADEQMGSLQRQRGELYDEMVAQIGREVKLIAEKRGINVVFSDIVAPAGGVDLTEDAEKDIESLHE